MKELSIEEKARRYDEVVNKLKGFMAQGVDPLITRADAQDFFPEFKESDDERIRKELIRLMRKISNTIVENYTPVPISDFIAWLEKQGGHAEFINGILVGDKVTRNEDGVLVNLSQLKRIAKPAEEYNIIGIGSKNAQGKLGEMIKNLKPVNEVLEQKPDWSEKYIADVFEKVGLAKIAREQGNENLSSALQSALIELGKFMSQQTSSWSEEDEKEVAVLEAYIRSNDWSERHIDRALGIVDELVNKVKSIRLQNTWKPSDEQMNNK